MQVFSRFYFEQSRAALSLLGYCYFFVQDYSAAADCYERLVSLHPKHEQYRLYLAQALYNACAYTEAMAAASQVEADEHVDNVIKLQAAIKYREDDLQNAKVKAPSN